MSLCFNNFGQTGGFLAVDSLHMPLLMIDPSEVFGANRAFERLLPRMSSYVGSQLLLGEKGFRTLRAFVGKDI